MKKRLFTGLLSLAIMFGCFAFPDSDFKTKASDLQASYKECGDYWYRVLEDDTAEIIYYSGEDYDVIIPETLDGFTVTSIGSRNEGGIISRPFEYRYDVCSVVIPDTVNNIGDSVFSFCYMLENITIPDTVTSIGRNAFKGTKWLKNRQSENPLVIVNNILVDGRTCVGNVIIPDTVTDIVEEAFHYNENITSVYLPNISCIKCATFEDCNNLKSVYIPDSVKSIERSAFAYCYELTNVILPDGLNEIGDNAFVYCRNLTNIAIPDTVTSIGGDAFIGTKWLEDRQAENPLVIVNGILIDGTTCSGKVTIPNNVTRIEYSAFKNCENLICVELPDSVTSIGESAFYNCDALKEVTVPKSVIEIENWALGYHDVGSGIITNEKLQDFIIKCYAGSAAEQYAIDNDFDYELLDPALQGSVYYQKKYNNSAVRFIAEVDIDDIKAADHSEIMICLNGEKQTVKTQRAFYSIISDDKKITAPEGKCFVISPAIEIGGDGADILTAEFTLDSYRGSIKREITI